MINKNSQFRFAEVSCRHHNMAPTRYMQSIQIQQRETHHANRPRNRRSSYLMVIL